jgi:hypothetical protein
MAAERAFMVFTVSWLQKVGVLLSLALLGGCAGWGGAGSSAGKVATLPAQGGLHFSPQNKAQWESVVLPGKLRTEFKLDQHGQRRALQADAQGSASMLRQRLHIPAERLGRMRFEWQVENLLAEADLSDRERGDSPVRIILAFDGDRSRFSAKNTMLSDLTEALTGEPMPYATLMYVWSNHHAVDTVIVNSRTDRIRKWVVESGPAHLKQWRLYQRDLRADFEKAFGEAPGTLIGVAIMSDADNTRSRTRAWYGDIHFD